MKIFWNHIILKIDIRQLKSMGKGEGGGGWRGIVKFGNLDLGKMCQLTEREDTIS